MALVPCSRAVWEMSFCCQMLELLKHLEGDGRLVASGTGPANGAWWPWGLFCRRQEADPAHTSLAGGRAGSTHKGFFGQLSSLEGSGKALPSVLTMFWVFYLVCGRQLQGAAGSWAVSPCPRGVVPAPLLSDPWSRAENALQGLALSHGWV